MITLSRHIEILLLEHDCVIIPGLGGFIANQASSRYSDSGDNLFLPPYRTIGFNKELSVNDGLLVQSYMQAYDAAYPEAYLQMEKDIDEMMAQLDTTGSYNLNGIGTLTKNLDEGITFSAIESGLLTPNLYGLYSVEIKSIEEVKKEKEIQKALAQTTIVQIESDTTGNTDTAKDSDNIASKTDSDATAKDGKTGSSDVVIHLHKRWLEFAAAAAAAVILFFVFTYPSLKPEDEMNDTCIASVVNSDKPKVGSIASSKHEPTRVVTSKEEVAMQTKKDNINNVSADNANTNTATAGTTNAQGSTTTNTAGSSTAGTNATGANASQKAKADKYAGKSYVIVLASCVGAKNANLFISNLSAEGFSEARFVRGSKNRVVYSAYSTEQEAANALASLRKQNPAFKDGWVFNMNE